MHQKALIGIHSDGYECDMMMRHCCSLHFDASVNLIQGHRGMRSSECKSFCAIYLTKFSTDLYAIWNSAETC